MMQWWIKELAVAVVNTARKTGAKVVTAESLTGGMVASEIVAVPGASGVLLAGFVAYTEDVKRALLDVPIDMIETYSVVSSEVALAMARGVLRLAGTVPSDGKVSRVLAVSTTGVAGPGPHGGHRAGTFHVAVVGDADEDHSISARFVVDGDRQAVREEATRRALEILLEQLDRIDQMGR